LYSGLLAGVVAAGLGLSLWLSSPQPAQTPPPFRSRVASDVEQRALVDALRLDLTRQRGNAGGELPEVNEDAPSFCPGGRRAMPGEDCGAMTGSAGEVIASTSFDLDFDARPGVPREFRMALIDANLEPRTSSFPDSIPAERASRSRTKTGDDHAGVLHVTWPVVSQDGTQALLYAVYRLSPDFAVGILFHLTRTDGQWQVQNAFTLWMT
jgi:hypothetical protein